MNTINKISRYLSGHRIQLAVVLCLFGLCVAQSRKVAKGRHRPKTDERVYLKHADMLRFNQYGEHAGAQILNGNVAFLHKGALLTCDSAYFYQESNSFKAFGHVKMRQGDTLSLTSDYAFYDGDNQMAEARHNVLLRHRGTKLYTDSLNYDRLYNIGYFFEGGKMVDRNNVLVSDWGEYDTETRKAVFNYNVNLRNPKFTLTTDTLHYDTRTSLANIVGPSVIRSKESVIHTSEGYYNTNTGRARLYGRSTMSNKGKEITGDSLFYDEKRGISQGYRNVIYKDTQKKNELHCNYLWYNEKNGIAFAIQVCHIDNFVKDLTMTPHHEYWEFAIAAAVSAMGFSTIFSIPRRLLPVVAVGGIIAVCFRNFVNLGPSNGNIGLDMGLSIGSLAGSALISVIVIKARHWFHTPHQCITIPSVIPMVPGVLMYRALFAFIDMHGVVGEVTVGMNNLIKASLAIICIALGVAIPNVFFRRFIADNRKRKLLNMLVERKKKNGEFVDLHEVEIK